MTETGQHFINESRDYLSNKYLPEIERCLEQLTDKDVWWHRMRNQTASAI